MVRSTVQRWRPSRCEDSTPLRAMRWVTVQLAAGTEFVEDQAVELGPHPGLRPLREPPVGDRAGRAERSRRQLLPGTTRCRHEDDRRQHFPVAVPTPTTTLRPRRRLRHHPLEQLPQLVRHQPLNDPHAGRLPAARERAVVSGQWPIRRCSSNRSSTRTRRHTPATAPSSAPPTNMPLPAAPDRSRSRTRAQAAAKITPASTAAVTKAKTISTVIASFSHRDSRPMSMPQVSHHGQVTGPASEPPICTGGLIHQLR